jgi:hypothetical protein
VSWTAPAERSGDGAFLPREAAHAALTQMCRVVLNLNEFVYPD